MIEPTEAQVEAAYQVIVEEIGLPTNVPVELYIEGPNSPEKGPEREKAIRHLREEEARFERQDREAVKNALRAALNVT